MAEFVDYKAITIDPSTYTTSTNLSIPGIQYFMDIIGTSPTTSTSAITAPDSFQFKYKGTPTDIPTEASASQQSSKTQSSSTALGAVAFAQSQVGKKYKWNTTGENGTYDCSGLIYRAYKEQGVDVPRSTEAWLNSKRTKVGSTEGQPGDVIITKSKSGRHARLITKNLGNGKYECVEAEGTKHGVINSTYSVDNKLLNIYRAQQGMKLIKKHGIQ